jgi:hypothetical protein
MGCMDDQPVTRTELRETLEAALAAQRSEIIDELTEVIRDSQTEILKAFLPYQEASSIRFRAVEAKLSNTDAGISERMAILERRLQEIEKKLLLNPPAA